MKAKRFKKDFLLYFIIFISVILGSVFLVWQMVPEYRQRSIPRLSYVRPFAFQNQYGDTITETDIKGKIVIAAFFFTTCRGICPKMNENMQQIYQTFLNDSSLIILSHTVDPDTDSVGQLLAYAKKMGVQKESRAKWYFLTGTKIQLYQQARESYTLDDPKNNVGNIQDQFIHTQFFALVDKKGAVLKVYDGLIQEEIKELIQDVKDIQSGLIAASNL